MLEVSHNSLALFGLAVVGVTAVRRRASPDLRHGVEVHALSWLQARHEARVQATAIQLEPELAEPDAVAARHRRRPARA